MTHAPGKPAKIPAIEWLAAALGLLLVLGTVIYLVQNLLTGTATPPAIRLTVENVAQTPLSYVVKINAENLGSETAADARIEGELIDVRGQVVERAEVGIDYLPGKSTRQLGLFFQNDPAQHRLRLRATGYRAP